MALSLCPSCQHPLTPGDDICPNCGAFTSTMAPIPPAAHQAVSPSLFLCPQCQTPLRPGEDFCEHCGALITPAGQNGASGGKAPLICSVCATAVKPGDDFCEHCGAVLDHTQLSSQQPSQTLPASQPQTSIVGVNVCPICATPRRPGKKFCLKCGYNYPPGKGEILGNKYRLDNMLGSGGMGAVWLAEDIVLHRKVVIKALLNNNDPDLVEQSVKEREFLARLNHGNIVSIYDCIAQGNAGYIVMEYIHGKTLEAMLEERQTPLKVPEAINYILGILPAFAYLGKLDIVYCDFKPPNIMVEMREDGKQVPKLIDMGTAIKYGPNPGRIYGTHGFYAREANKHPSPQTDLYSICRTLAYLVTLMDLDNPVFGMPPAQAYPEFQQHPALYRLLAKGTHDDPARRFQSAEELEEQLRGVLRFCANGPDMPFVSVRFVSPHLTSTGRLGRRGETTLDERDRTIKNLSSGDQALHNGNLTGAIHFYEQALNDNPRSIDAYARLVDTYIEQAQVQSAEQVFTRASRVSANHWKARWSQARLYEALGEWARAEQLYQDLTLDLPGEIPPLQALARVYARQGKLSTAIQIYEYILKAEPGNVDALFASADCLLKQQRWDDAIHYLSNVSETSSRYIDAQVLLCDIYAHRSLPALPAVADLVKATELVNRLKGHISDARYYLLRGEIYYLAWQMAREKILPEKTVLAEVPQAKTRELGRIAESSYKQYLRTEQPLAPREEIIRRKFAVTAWRF